MSADAAGGRPVGRGNGDDKNVNGDDNDDRRGGGGATASASSPSSTSYTATLAYDPSRRRSRTSLGRYCLLNYVVAICSKRSGAPTTASLLLDDVVLGSVSAVTFVYLSLFLIVGMVCLIPSVILSKAIGWPSFVHRTSSGAVVPASVTASEKKQRDDDDEDEKNLSHTHVGSVTAIKAMMGRAQMCRQGSGGPDVLAPALMDRASLMGPNVPGSGTFTNVFLLLERMNYYLTGRVFQDQICSLLKKHIKIGVAAFLQVRTCFLDDAVETFVRSHTNTDTGNANVNVVILGAGYDTRCYRMNLAERGVRTYEVDASGTQNEKRRKLREAGIDEGTTAYVPCDFETQDWLEELKRAPGGFDPTLPTFFVWEGVTYYLSRDAVKSTIEKVSTTCRSGSMIAFDYFDRTWALSGYLAKATKRGGEAWIFGMTGTEPEELVAECSGECDGTGEGDDRDSSSGGGEGRRRKLEVLDHVEYEELIDRYMPKHCDGRPIGFLDDFGGMILVGSC